MSEKTLNYHQIYYLKNKDRLRPIRKKWEELNKEKRKEIKQRFFNENPEKKYEYAKKFRLSNPSKWRKVYDKHKLTSKYVLNRLKSGAKRRNLMFELTLEDVTNIISKQCNYCGETDSISIDRVDNKIGYTKENSVPCCTMCNMMKKDFDLKDFLQKVCKIYQNHY